MIFIDYCDKYKDVYNKYITFITKYLYNEIKKKDKPIIILSPLNDLEDHLEDFQLKGSNVILLKISLRTDSKNTINILYSRNGKSLVDAIEKNLGNDVIVKKQVNGSIKHKYKNLHVLSLKFGVFIKKELLEALNGLVESFITYDFNTTYISNKIVKVEKRTDDREIKYYYVQPEDNIWSIAKKFDTTAEKIIEVNKLNDTSLNLGQKLLIPGLYKSKDIVVIEYMVIPGDTIWYISHKFRVPIKDIRDYNYLNTNVLENGQILQLVVNEDNEEEIYEN